MRFRSNQVLTGSDFINKQINLRIGLCNPHFYHGLYVRFTWFNIIFSLIFMQMVLKIIFWF